MGVGEAKLLSELEALIEVIEKAAWRATKFISPHEYILKKDEPELFEAMKKFVRENGWPGRFFKTIYRYATVGEYRYWFMSSGPKSIILNRARLDIGGVERLDE